MNFKARVNLQFSRAAHTYDEAAPLQYQSAQSLAAWLPELNPQALMDLGTGTGYGMSILQDRYPEANHYGIDLSHAMLQQAQKKHSRGMWINADFDALPLPTAHLDLIFSNLALQWSPHLPSSLAEMNRVLDPEGYLLFSTLTAGTAAELKAAFFLSEQSVLDAVQQAGFVINHHILTPQRLYFPSVAAALSSLKKIGATAHLNPSQPGLNARAKLRQLNATYPKDAQGYPLSYQILFISARKKS
jgi:malonyl-CoA O-methyltransferase